MSAPTNHWKLGAFVVGAVLLGLAVAMILAAQTLQVQTVTYVSYFDEGVSGLEVGSPVSFRGVKIGNVSQIDVAPDRRHVEITYQLGTRVLSRLGLAMPGQGKETKLVVPSDVRVQIASTGLTGTKFVQLDFFDPKIAPLPQLPFPVPENYIPATASTMKNLEDAVIRAVDQFPALAQAVQSVLAKIDAILDDLERKGIPTRAAQTLSSANQMIGTLQVKLNQLDVDQLSHQTNALLKNANTAVVKLQRVIDRVDGEHGLLASVQRTSDSLGDSAGAGMGDTIRDTARDLREAATAIREFLEALQRDPDMLIKGKAKEHP